MPRILVVDDDAAISEIVCINLEMAGYEVKQAPDGIQGQAMAIQMVPDLVMLDVQMPGLAGFEVARRLKALGSFYGALPAHDGLWDAAYETRHEAAARVELPANS